MEFGAWMWMVETRWQSKGEKIDCCACANATTNLGAFVAFDCLLLNVFEKRTYSGVGARVTLGETTIAA